MTPDSALQITQAFTQGDISAVAIAENYLARIEKLDRKLGAFLTVFTERVMEKARLLDHKRKTGKPLGKLAGVPIAIKDNIHISGEITTCASKFLKNYRAPFHATAVHLLEEEDALLIGKTNLDEFAMGSSCEHSALQRTCNPWNLDKVPGGSSGGSAAAVSARLCPIALGSDTGGSIRQPAGLCGIVGFKPTYGRISRFGLVSYASSFDQIGPMTATVSDAALAMEVMGRQCKRDATTLPSLNEEYFPHFKKDLKGVRIGIPLKFLKNLQEEAKDNFSTAIEVLKGLGASIVDVDLSMLNYAIATYYILATAEASTNLARFDGIRFGHRSPRATTLDEVYEYSKEEGYGSEVKRRILLGTYVLSSGFKDAYYSKAQKIRRLIRDQYQSAFFNCDLIAMPVSPFPAFGIGAIHDSLQMYLADIYTISINLAGVPSISVPSGFSKEHLPFGLQLIGPQREDVRVLSMAYAYEQATLWGRELPPILNPNKT